MSHKSFLSLFLFVTPLVHGVGPSFNAARYDRAITVFAPDGSLFQVEYASTVGKRGAPAVALVDGCAVILAAWSSEWGRGQDDGLVEGQKLVMIDEHIYAAAAGLRADGRVLFDRARQECQEYRLQYGEAPSVAHIARFIADLKHSFTRTGGTRPFGVECLITGVDANGKARIFKTEPSGSITEWFGAAIGTNADTALHRLAADDSAYTDDKPSGETEDSQSQKGSVATRKVCAALNAAREKNKRVEEDDHERRFADIVRIELDATGLRRRSSRVLI